MRTGSVDTARMKGGWGLIAVAGLALAALAGPSWAGTIYRCDTADGDRSYVSKRVKGATCVAVSNYRSAPSRPPARPVAAGGSPANPVAGSRSEERRVGKECSA